MSARITHAFATGSAWRGVPESFYSGGEFAGLPRLNADEVRSLLFGHRLHGRAASGREEYTALFTNDGVATSSGGWSWSNIGTIAMKGDDVCFKWGGYVSSDCVVILRNPDGTKTKENEYIWIDQRGAFPFSQVE